ncbi:hypothetical protein [Streptomyces sp. H27-D2]|uniref:hypothetical protein n=1 Tax=Streptomyces sp. H27-D2 TaxID=3046304 RepID=UPI002DBB7C24|nr:hypothetical protein [Streptomyces sp. H27-D2]MEC4014939.1 hypothetical protein [Streptomyces sp. H27-D2]
MNELDRAWLTAAAPKAAPALATSTVLILARIWSANGAEHSVGNAWLMGALAVGAALAGMAAATGRHGEGALAATAFATSGALAVAGVTAYADTPAPGLLLWAVATVLAYVLSARHWRTEHHHVTAHTRAMEAQREAHRHTETVELIRARTQVESLAYAVQLSEAQAHRAGLPGFEPTALTRTGLPELARPRTK